MSRYSQLFLIFLYKKVGKNLTTLRLIIKEDFLMERFQSIEELIIDDSFANYCFNRNREDYSYWKNFIKKHPECKQDVEEAKKIVLGLHAVLKEKNEEVIHLVKKDPKVRKKRWFGYVAAAAVVALVLLVGSYFLKPSYDSAKSEVVANAAIEKDFLYTTQKGERKMITLFDGTKIWLNADSRLEIDENYGKEDRKVSLIGEALFDVVHNDQLPFVVYTENYEVVDLGTIFNIMTYPGDESSEASLIQGKIRVKFSGNDETILLEPDQKIVIKNKTESTVSETNPVDNLKKISSVTKSEVEIVPLTYSMSDSMVVETAWVDRLEINNESLYEMQVKMERWFGVDIAIADSAVGKYPFTATFKKENIREALEALQYAYRFNFKIDGNDVTITK